VAARPAPPPVAVEPAVAAPALPAEAFGVPPSSSLLHAV
jgi:hypothetical protein